MFALFFLFSLYQVCAVIGLLRMFVCSCRQNRGMRSWSEALYYDLNRNMHGSLQPFTDYGGREFLVEFSREYKRLTFYRAPFDLLIHVTQTFGTTFDFNLGAVVCEISPILSAQSIEHFVWCSHSPSCLSTSYDLTHEFLFWKASRMFPSMCQLSWTNIIRK